MIRIIWESLPKLEVNIPNLGVLKSKFLEEIRYIHSILVNAHLAASLIIVTMSDKMGHSFCAKIEF